MFHNSQAVLAISKAAQSHGLPDDLGVNDYYFSSEAWEFPMGATIQMVGKSVARDMYRGERPTMTRLAPTFSLAEIAEHAVDFWLSTEDLPQPENRVSVDKDGNVTLNYHSSQRRTRGDRLSRAAAIAAGSSRICTSII